MVMNSTAHSTDVFGDTLLEPVDNSYSMQMITFVTDMHERANLRLIRCPL